jgi:hypothetical protein
LFLDYTNNNFYDPELWTFLGIASDLRAKGLAVPKIVFFLNRNSDRMAESLYLRWYRPGFHDDMWFKWGGKPLIMAPRPTDPSKINDPKVLAELQDYFTWRPTWDYFESSQEPTKWRFMDMLQLDGRPRAALGPDGKPEQIVVNKSMGAPVYENMRVGGVSTFPGHVPTYNDQWLSGEQAQGLFFQHSWDNALRNPAPILLVTGWNEWKASVWEQPGLVMLGRTTTKGQGHFVDEFNMDFNRDIEPMRGGYGDDYYWQFLSNMRMYKGMLPPVPSSEPKTIRVDGPLGQWDDVKPLFKNPATDAGVRDWDGTIPGTHYSELGTRNEIVACQVAFDDRNLYFRATTSANLTDPQGRSWMMLLIDADRNSKTGWNGYDFLIDRDRRGNGCTIEQNVGGAWKWRRVGRASMHRSGHDLVLCVPRRTLGLDGPGTRLAFDFKWADNIPAEPDIMDFYTKGDVAPIARFNYRFTAPP